MSKTIEADSVEYEAADRLEQLAQKYFGPETAPVNVSFGALSHGGKDNVTVVLARYLVAPANC